MSEQATYKASWRDRAACWLANRALLLATPEYRAFVNVTSRLGVGSLIPERRVRVDQIGVKNLHSGTSPTYWLMCRVAGDATCATRTDRWNGTSG